MDLISSLPDSIIDTILAHLPLREAVRTSILSREWRYKWTSIPHLVFDCLVDRISNRGIGQVVHQHQGPLNKFSLKCRTSPYIDQCILLLSSSHVHDFALHKLDKDKHVIPSHFFSFQNLKHLYLYDCTFKPPPEFKGFSKLAKLDFQNVEYVPSMVEHFISQCPLLEHLTLENCTKLDAFEIQGPRLRFFSFAGVFNTISFKKTLFLAEVSLTVRTVQHLGLQSSPGFKHFQVLPTVEKLHLHALVLELLSAGHPVPRRLPYSFECLKYLNVSMLLSCVNEVASVFCLARSCPNLHTLRVALYIHEDVKAVIEFMRAQETPDNDLRQLKRVDIELEEKVISAEIELLRFLLASAAGLEEMVITHSAWSYDGIVMNQLYNLARASPTVLVFYRIRDRLDIPYRC